MQQSNKNHSADTIDDHVDEKIKECIKTGKNFFMFAGAGSGKTRSLVNALQYIANEFGSLYREQGRKVAIITYTNAAAEEILRRVGNNDLFEVLTIHSFLWELIKTHQRDIKKWVENKLKQDIDTLKEKQSKARSADYSGNISKKQDRLDALAKIYRFTYDPNGANAGKDSLNHAEVIKMGADFISDYVTMQEIMISKFPILFIDESQDTKKELVDALLKIESVYPKFLIGMFGDIMQRIYMDGKENMDKLIPDTWEKPIKKMNHRSGARIIALANSIRESVDSNSQQSRSDRGEGFVRLFVIPNTVDKNLIEGEIKLEMSRITKDKKWLEPNDVKTLVLEHSMAATRLGFDNLNEALSRVFDQDFRDGTLAELAFLMKVIHPLVVACQNKKEFEVMKILRAHALMLKPNSFMKSDNQSQVLKDVSLKVDALVSLWGNDKVPKCIDVYKKLHELKFFELSKRMDEVLDLEIVDIKEKVGALRSGLEASFSELIQYWDYVAGKTQFDTHQGIKGLEFARVAVIMDDENAGGFLFSYEKLFGAKELTATDKRNQIDGRDSSIERTRRLFYVTCTRAIESLALIAYTADPEKIKKTVLDNKWFSDEEIVMYNSVCDGGVALT